MSKKIAYAIFLFILSSMIIGCTQTSEYTIESYVRNREKAVTICGDRNGELIHYGVIVNPNNLKQHFESVCYKEDERHFYYDFIE